MSGYFKVSYEDADESEVFGTYEEAMEHLNKVAEKGIYSWVQICDEEWDILYEWVKPRKSKKNKK